MDIQYCWNDAQVNSQIFKVKPVPVSLLHTVRSKWTKLELKCSLRNEVSKTNCLCHCTALPVTCDLQRETRVKIIGLSFFYWYFKL